MIGVDEESLRLKIPWFLHVFLLVLGRNGRIMSNPVKVGRQDQASLETQPFSLVVYRLSNN